MPTIYDFQYQNIENGFGQPDLGVSDYPDYVNQYASNPGANARLNQLLQQSNTPQDAASLLKELAKQDDAYSEMYLQLLAERENQERAYKWYEDFNSSYFQRTAKDLEAAGLNPWLALQSLGSSGSGSLTPAGSWSGTSGSSSKVKRDEIKAQNLQKITGASIGAVAAILGAIIMALV